MPAPPVAIVPPTTQPEAPLGTPPTEPEPPASEPGPPVTEPPVTEPQPPVTEPEPPVTEPPTEPEPSVTEPPVTEPAPALVAATPTWSGLLAPTVTIPVSGLVPGDEYAIVVDAGLLSTVAAEGLTCAGSTCTAHAPTGSITITVVDLPLLCASSGMLGVVPTAPGQQPLSVPLAVPGLLCLIP